MSTKTLLISSVLSGFLFSVAAGYCFADASEQLKQAETYKNVENYEQAEHIYQQIVADFPGSNYALEAQKKLTLMYIAIDSQQQAGAAFEQLVTDFSEHTGISQAVWQIAKGYEQPKKYDKALELHQYNVQHFSPDMHAMWSQTEVVYLNINSGENTAADTAFEKLLTLFSSRQTLPKEIHQIATKYNSLKRYDKALELYQYNAEHSSKDNMYAMWSQVEMVKSHFRDANDAAVDEACDTLLDLFSEQPTLPKEIYQIADLYNKSGKNDKALDLHQSNVELISSVDKYTMWSLVEIIKSHISDPDDDAANEACDKLLAQFSQLPAFPTELYQIAMIYKKSGRPEKAFQLHKYNIEHSSKDDMYTMWSKVEIIKSYIRDANDAADEAFNTLLTDFSRQPTLPKEIYQVVDEYALAGRYDKAGRLYNHVLDNWPEARQAGLKHIGVAEINLLSLIDSGNYTAARDTLDTLIADFNDHPDLAWTLDGIAERYEKAEQYGQARSIYQKIVTDYNETDYALTAQKKRTILEIKVGDDIAAQVALELLITDFNDHSDLPEAVFVVGEQYYNRAFQYKKEKLEAEAKDNFRTAIAVWERVITELPPSTVAPDCYNFIAVCYDRIGKYVTAIKYYQQVLDDWPDYQYACSVQFRIGQCYQRLRDAGSLSKSEADIAIRAAYEAVVRNYPDCPATPAARNWLNYNSKSAEGGQK